MPNENKQNQVVQTNNLDNNLISSEEVEVAVRGDEEALLKQMERVKELTKQEQITDAEKQALALQKKKQQQEIEKLKQQEEEKRLIEEHKKNEELKKKQEVNKQPINNQGIQQPVPKPTEQPKQVVQPKQEEKPKTMVRPSSLETPKKQNMQEEKKPTPIKEETTNNTPRFMGLKRTIAFLFLGGVIAMIWFMPDINALLEDYRKSKMPVTEITTGLSICTFEKTYENKDVKTTMKFKFVNKKINKLEYVTETRSEESKEKNTEIYNSCLLLKKEAEGIAGVVISCSLNGKVITSKQILNYEYIDSEKLSTAYLEAGGVYPDVKNGDDISRVEEKLKTTGYKCEREDM